MSKTVLEISQQSGRTPAEMLEYIKAAGLKQSKADDVLDEASIKKLLTYIRLKQQKSQSNKLSPLGLRSKDSYGTSGIDNKIQVKRKRTVNRADVLSAENLQKEQERLRQEKLSEEKVASSSPKTTKPESAIKEDAEENKGKEAQAKEQAKEVNIQTTKPKDSPLASPAAKKSVKSKTGDNKKIEPNTANKHNKGSKFSKGKTTKVIKNITKEEDLTKGKITAVVALQKRDQEALNNDTEKVVAVSNQQVVRVSNKHSFVKPKAKIVKEIKIDVDGIKARDLALQAGVKFSRLARELRGLGVAINSEDEKLDFDSATLIVESLGHKALQAERKLPKVVKSSDNQSLKQEKRPAVVTIMGHVDHGKTTLLDTIRKSKVVASEAGSITQHIGAYHVKTSHGVITFIDTPGHAAFSAIRARGSRVTDIVILVVAADDGVKEQTAEAIKHIKASGVNLIVAINKIDKENIDLERIKSELSNHEIISEEWGGDVQFVNISALNGTGIDKLLEAINLQAEIMELQAPVKSAAGGVVLEMSMQQGRGIVATLLVMKGTLRAGDFVVAGSSYGKARALMDENGVKCKQVGPALPVQLLGLDEVAEAGDKFTVVANKREARDLADYNLEIKKQQEQSLVKPPQEEDLFNFLEDESKQLNLIVKADVRGSLEAVISGIDSLDSDKVKLKVLTSGIGAINESDAMLAQTSQAIIIGFNVRADQRAKSLLNKSNIEIRYYSVIYQLLEEVEKSQRELIPPEIREKILGVAEVKDVFLSKKFGQIAGCVVSEGTIYRNKPIRVLRKSVVIFEGELESLRHFKDNVEKVSNGSECGIGVKAYKDIVAGDQIEVYELVETRV